MTRSIRSPLLAKNGALEFFDIRTAAADARFGKFSFQSGLVSLNALAKRMRSRRRNALFSKEMVVNEEEGEKGRELIGQLLVFRGA